MNFQVTSSVNVKGAAGCGEKCNCFMAHLDFFAVKQYNCIIHRSEKVKNKSENEIEVRRKVCYNKTRTRRR